MQRGVVTEHWKYPVLEPLFTDALAQEIVEAAKAGVPYSATVEAYSDADKPKAHDTRWRFSDIRCERQQAYDDLGAPKEVWDAASLHVAFVGSVYHALLQPAIQRRFPGAEVEVKGILPEANSSGHADGVIDRSILTAVVSWDGGRALFELKSKGTYQFDKAVGIMRKNFCRAKEGPGGPGLDVLIQGGMNAKAHGCDTVVIGYVCFENFSVGLARQLQLRQMDRFLAEWHVPREVWLPLVEREILRLQKIGNEIDLGYLPDRLFYDEEDWGQKMILKPENKKPYWRCDYCSYRERCIDDGPGVIEIPVDLRKKESA